MLWLMVLVIGLDNVCYDSDDDVDYLCVGDEVSGENDVVCYCCYGYQYCFFFVVLVQFVL